MSEKTHKTEPLMKLLNRSGGSQIENPIINNDFKHDVIHAKPDQRKPQQEQSQTNSKGVNVIAELIDELLPEAVDRYKCCKCDVCMAEMTVEILNSVSPKYVNIDTPDGLEQLEKAKSEYREEVIKNMVSIVIKRRANPKH